MSKGIVILFPGDLNNCLIILFFLALPHSQEEIESLRERMQAQTSLVVVGSADDLLRVGHTKRQIEGVTQNMVDNMIVDEVFEFAASCIVNPPAPRDLSAELAAQAKLANGGGGIGVPVAAPQPPAGSVSQNSSTASKKRKNSQDAGDSSSASTKALKSSAANSSRGSASGKCRKGAFNYLASFYSPSPLLFRVHSRLYPVFLLILIDMISFCFMGAVNLNTTKPNWSLASRVSTQKAPQSPRLRAKVMWRWFTFTHTHRSVVHPSLHPLYCLLSSLTTSFRSNPFSLHCNRVMLNVFLLRI